VASVRLVAWDPLRGWRAIAVYGRGQKYVVTSARRYGYGPDYRTPPYIIVRRGASDEEFGNAIIEAMEAYTVMAEPPSDEVVDAAARELFEVVGVADDRAFARGASLVHVEERKRKWSVQPWGRTHGSWHPLNEDTFIELASPAPSEIGEAVRTAFVVLRGHP
jgi:hypothetical protein